MYETSIINRVAIGDIMRRTAGKFPDKIGFVEGDKRLTFKEADDMSNQFANYLLSKGYKKGDTIATLCINSVEFVITMYGIAKAGLIWVPINPGITTKDKEYILNKIEPKLIIGNDMIIKADQTLYDSLSEVITMDGKLESYHALFSDQSTNEPDIEIQDNDPAQIMFTSGTTGEPKGVVISHQSVYITSLSNLIEIGARPSDIGAVVLPLFHCAQHSILTSFIHLGAKNVIFSTFEPESFMATIEKEKISFTAALPMIYRALLHHPSRKKYDLSSLKLCLYAMAPMDRKTLEMLIKEFKADFMLGTGQTEMYPATMTFKPEEQLKRFGSYWGVSSILNDTAIMDAEGNLLDLEEIGEIVHRGPNVMLGYLDNQEETEKSRQFGWHHTGDIGYWDKDRQLVFVDRKKDIIKTGGENVASIKVEQVLLNHEKIANAVAIGVPHKHWYEAVTAIIVPNPDIELTQAEVIDYCKEHLGSFEIPKSVVFVEELPMTSTGKVQKNILRAEYEDHYQLEQS